MERKIVVFLLVLYFLNFSFLSTVLGDYVCKQRNGKIPKPGSFCRVYYYCRNWRPKEIVCPEDQHFFPAKGYCVWPEEYPCAEKRNSKECPTPNGKFPKPDTGCRRYYDCCNGKPSEKACPGDTLFDHVRKKCEWPELYTCNDDPASKKCQRPNGKFLKPGTRCKIYYDCNNGHPTEKKCPSDQLFHQKKERCEWSELVVCEDAISTRKTSTSLYTSTSSSRYIDSSEEDSGSKEKRRSTTSVTTEEDSSEEKGSSSSEETRSTRSSKTPWPFASSTAFSSSLSVEITTSSSNSPSTYKDTITTDSASTTVSTASSYSPVEITISSSYPPLTVEEISKTDSISTTLTTASNYSPTSSSHLPFTDEKSSKTASDSVTSSTASSNSSVESTTSGSYPPFTNKESSRTDSVFTTVSTTSESLPIETSSNFSSTSEEHVKTENLVSTPSSTSSDDLLLELTTASSRFTEEDSIKPEDSSSTLSTVSTRDDSSASTAVNIFCPEPNGYFPHPTDKHKFIGCVDGDPRILTCPANLVYNHKKRACVYG